MVRSGRLLVVGLTFAAALAWANGTVLAQAHPDKPNMGCASCHVPHKAVKQDGTTYGVPLWSPAAVTTTTGWTVYSSPAFDALSTGISQPDGPTKLCLGCHDGSAYGLAAGVTPTHSFASTGSMTLTTTHPVSFVYDKALSNNPALHVPGELKDPTLIGTGLVPVGGTVSSGSIDSDMLDKNHKVQCTSCHDVHSSGAYNVGTWDLRMDYSDGKSLCQKCHNK